MAAGAAGEERGFLEARKLSARFYAEHVMPRARAYLAAVLAGSDSLMALEESQFEH